MLELVNVSKYYTSNNITNLGLRNINLKLSKGEIVAITGESGSGKSTLLNVITKMDTFDEGEVYFKGNETSYFSIDDMDSFRKNKVGFIFQNYNIIDSYSVLENVMMPYTLNGMESKDAKEKAIELIKKVGLQHRIKNHGSELSGGEKQRCVIARALASNAEILACDEPTGNLDSKTGIEIINLIKEVAKDKLVLIVTHNYDEVKDIVTRKLKIHDGELVEDEIIEKTITQDEDEVLDLDYKPISKKISFNVAIKNLLKTPKKTILTSLVILFVSLFSISLYQAIMYLNSNESYYNSFYYLGKEKLIAYDINHNALDKTTLDELKNEGLISSYVINPFYEKTSIYGGELYDYTSYNYFYYYGYEANPSNLEKASDLKEGRMPESENECILLVPQSASNIDSSLIINKELSLGIFREETDLPTYKIVGYQIRSDISNVVLTKCDNLEKFYRVYSSILNDYNLEFKVLDENGDETSIGYYSVAYKSGLEKTYVKYNPEFYSKVELKDIYYGPYKIAQGITNLDKVETTDSYIEVVIGEDIASQLTNTIYEVSLYTSNVKKLESKLAEKNISYLQPSTHSETTELERFITNLWGYFSILMSSGTILIIFFISYIVLSKIYSSKKKDYTIIRTLGLTKKDMRSIVRIEVFLNTSIITLLVYLTVFLLGKYVDKSVLVIFREISIPTTILYFIVMLLFAYFISKRFNTRLFKYSVNKTLKAEEVKND